MKRKISLISMAVFICLMTVGSAYALSTYLTAFNTKYGTTSTALNTCGVCHINPAGGGSRNPYGTSFEGVSTHSTNPSGAFTTIEPLDSDGDGYSNITEINARTFPGDATSFPAGGGTTTDTTAPTVTVFTVPSTSSSLSIPISALSATDNVGVTGYIVTQSSTKPSATATGWSATAPSSYSVSAAGTYTLYAFAKDAAGNVSAGVRASVTVTLSSGGGTGAGTTGISGVVKDIVTGAAISGATITNGSVSASTSSTGAYTLNVAAGKYTLKVSKSGYLTTNQVASVSSGTSTTVNWALTKSYGTQAIPARNMNYVIFAWNDLGMHCDQNDYSYFMVLPPYNTLHAQVFQRGSEGANLLTSGITVSYAFPKKTNSALHTNFWAYAPQYGFNVPTNVGISGTPLAGNMTLDSRGLSWEAVGIPITPYDDDGTWDPYGTAVITVKNSSGQVLQTANVVAPVSTEMMCSNCHGTTNPQLSILQAHDAYNGTTLAADQAKGTVHACAECHADNALGMPGKAGVENLSLAMHNFHKDKMNTAAQATATVPGCYNCHPGPKTQCLRGIMFRAGKTCEDCHGDMYGMTNGILAGRQPWLQEPQCGGCHGATYSENANTLFRNSVLMNAPESMGGKIYCEACHNGTHAEYTTANPADPTIPMQLQGDNYWIWNCNVCHSATQQNMHRAVSSTNTTTFTISASAGTGGSISPSGSVSVTSGGSQSFTITPASGYAISGVVVDGTSVGAVSSYTFSNVTANHTITASFKSSSTTTTYTITASAGTGGSISPSGTVYVSSGSSQSFRITAASGYRIYRVLVDGNSVGAVSSYTFSNVSRNHTISASFTRSTHSN